MPALSLRRLSLLGCTLALAGVAGCGDSAPDGSADAERAARSALREVEPDLERLATSVDAADAGKRATLVEVQAAAGRASGSLGDARRALRDELDRDGLDASAERTLREQVAGVKDLQELTDALASATLSSPRIEAASARAKLALDDLADDLEVPSIDAEALAEDLRDTRTASASRRDAKTKAANDDAARTGTPSAPVGGGSASSGQAFAYSTYQGPAFQAQLPTGAGWGSPSASEPTPNQLFRTNVRGPGGLFVIVDYTPFEKAVFGGNFSSRTVVGQVAFGSAVKYEFQGGRIAECQRSACTDYIINGPGSEGFAVLAGGGPGSGEVARTVAESVVPVGE